jgi:UDPglucose--hexose-1-phosphate uridylyltransferase
MLELRWNPILKQWIIVATHRQNRTYKPPKDYCPLCPIKKGGLPTEVPAEDYDIVVLENKFPSLQKEPTEIREKSAKFFKITRAFCLKLVHFI